MERLWGVRGMPHTMEKALKSMLWSLSLWLKGHSRVLGVSR